MGIGMGVKGRWGREGRGGCRSNITEYNNMYLSGILSRPLTALSYPILSLINLPFLSFPSPPP